MSGPGILAARLLGGYRHGFTTREGGASLGAFESLNLSFTVGDDPALVRENWARVRAATGLAFARVRQVHGCRVVEVEAGTEPIEEADAVTTSVPGVAACVSIADCVPVLLADPRSGAVAARSRSQFSRTRAGSSPTVVERFRVAKAPRETPPSRVVNPCLWSPRIRAARMPGGGMGS